MYPQLLRLGPAHHKGIGVVEADRVQPFKVIQGLEPALYIPVHTIPVGGKPFRFTVRWPEDRQQRGAGVFGIEIDLVIDQRLEADLCPAEPCLAFHFQVGVAPDQLGVYIGEDILFGKDLGAQPDRAPIAVARRMVEAVRKQEPVGAFFGGLMKIFDLVVQRGHHRVRRYDLPAC